MPLAKEIGLILINVKMGSRFKSKHFLSGDRRMSKFNISFNVDMQHIAPELVSSGNEINPVQVEEAFTSMILEEARKHAKSELHRIRKDADMDQDVKAIKMSEQLRKMMFSLMAEANVQITPIEDSAIVQTELPFERRYAA